METFYGSYHGNIIKGIADIFIDLWDWFNFIWEAIKAIPQAIIDLLGSLLKWLFVPSENFFNDNIEEIKEKISEKIPYTDYVRLFETIKTLESDNNLSIDLPKYQITENLEVEQNKFIDFGRITKYKETWFAWVRGFTFIFMIIYNLNQITKFLRGINVADGATALGLEKNTSIGGKNQ